MFDVPSLDFLSHAVEGVFFPEAYVGARFGAFESLSNFRYIERRGAILCKVCRDRVVPSAISSFLTRILNK